MNNLFGTDGIRGVAYEFLNYELALNVGRALAHVLNSSSTTSRKILIGTDTRESKNMLTDALCEGLTSSGYDCVIAGVISTPAIAHLTRTCGFASGIMITASHNPYKYNGIKIFGEDGFKLSDAEEDVIADIINSNKDLNIECKKPGCVVFDEKLREIYVKYLIDSVSIDLSGMRLLIDCANGSSYSTAKDVFGKSGAFIEFYATEPDGKNINENCGSTHIENLKERVIEGHFDAAIAFDGDADRCLAIDERGCEIDGDHILAILALHLRVMEKLSADTVVGTVMANCGFTKFCQDNGINFKETKVGDRYVLEEMERGAFSLGGEQSGHVILRDFATTGDGQLTALFLLSALKNSNKKLSELASVMTKYPQHMINIKASNSAKAALSTDPRVIEIKKFAEDALNSDGRLLIRASGTEPLIRVMVESSCEEKTASLCKKIAEELETALSKY